MSYDKVKQAGDISVGVKQTVKALEKEQLREVVIASDADTHVIEPIIHMCEQYGVPVSYVDSMKQLGTASSIDVGASTVGIFK